MRDGFDVGEVEDVEFILEQFLLGDHNVQEVDSINVCIISIVDVIAKVRVSSDDRTSDDPTWRTSREDLDSIDDFSELEDRRGYVVDCHAVRWNSFKNQLKMRIDGEEVFYRISSVSDSSESQIGRLRFIDHLIMGHI